MTIYWTRTDSNSANNPALNSTGAASIQIEFVTSGTNGDLILEQPAPGTVDPDTQVMINGAAYDFVFELSGTMPTTNNNGANQVPDQYKGSDVYVITVYDYPSAGDTTRLYFFPNETATQAEMDSIGNGAIDIQNLDMTPPEGPGLFRGRNGDPDPRRRGSDRAAEGGGSGHHDRRGDPPDPLDRVDPP